MAIRIWFVTLPLTTLIHGDILFASIFADGTVTYEHATQKRDPTVAARCGCSDMRWSVRAGRNSHKLHSLFRVCRMSKMGATGIPTNQTE